jgi:hypothetical protein
VGKKELPKRQAIKHRDPKTLSTPVEWRPDGKPAFSFQLVDKSSPYSFGFDLTADEKASLVDFMADISQSTWREIEQQTFGGKGRKHHFQPTDSLGADAKTQLAKDHLVGLIDERLFRFRHGNTIRIWGRRDSDSDTFYFLWWDRDHRVYPTEPRNT